MFDALWSHTLMLQCIKPRRCNNIKKTLWCHTVTPHTTLGCHIVTPHCHATLSCQSVVSRCSTTKALRWYSVLLRYRIVIKIISNIQWRHWQKVFYCSFPKQAKCQCNLHYLDRIQNFQVFPEWNSSFIITFSRWQML